MPFIDFLYYLIYKAYAGYRNEKSPDSTSSGILGGLFTLNITTVYILIAIISKSKIVLNKLLIIGVFVVLQIWTYIRYIYKDSCSIAVLEKEWLNKSDAYRNRVTILAPVYIIISIVGLFALAIFLGERNRA